MQEISLTEVKAYEQLPPMPLTCCYILCCIEALLLLAPQLLTQVATEIRQRHLPHKADICSLAG